MSGAAKFTRDRRGIDAFLRSAELGAAVTQVARDVAARVAAAPAKPYDRLPQPIVQQVPAAGVRRDRVGAEIIVPAPAPADLRFPDTKGRFRAVAGVVGQVSGQ